MQPRYGQLMKTRPAAGGLTLDEAMEREIEFADQAALMTYLRERFDFWSPTDANVTIEPYSVTADTGEPRLDERTGWHTHLLCIDGKATLFTDGPMVGVPLPADYKPTVLIY